MPASAAAEELTSCNVEKNPQPCVKNSCLQDWTARLSIFNCSLGLNTAFTLPVYRLPSSSFPSRFLSDVTRQRDWNCWLVTFLQRVHLFPVFPFSVPQPLKDYYLSPCTLFERQRHQLFVGICVKTSCNTSGFLILVVKAILGYLYVANTWFPIIILRDISVWGGYFVFEKKDKTRAQTPTITSGRTIWNSSWYLLEACLCIHDLNKRIFIKLFMPYSNSGEWNGSIM